MARVEVPLRELKALSVRQASQLTGFTPYAIREAIHRKELDVIHAGRVMRISMTALDRWLEGMPSRASQEEAEVREQEETAERKAARVP